MSTENLEHCSQKKTVVSQETIDLLEEEYTPEALSELSSILFEKHVKKDEKKILFLTSNFGAFNISVRAQNCLKANNFTMVFEFANCTFEQTPCLNFGKKSFGELQELFSDHGLELGNVHPLLIEEARKRVETHRNEKQILFLASHFSVICSGRTFHILKFGGLKYVFELAKMTLDEMFHIKNFSETLTGIKKLFFSEGLELEKIPVHLIEEAYNRVKIKDPSFRSIVGFPIFVRGFILRAIFFIKKTPTFWIRWCFL